MQAVIDKLKKIEADLERSKVVEQGAGGGGGAPATAKYLTLATDGTLTQERVLTPGSGLSGTDAGAGSTYTLGVNVDGSTLEINANTLREKDGGTTNAKLANMVEATVKGRASAAGTGVPTDLSAAQLVTIIKTVNNFWPFAHILTVSATDPDAQYSTIASAIAAASANDLILIDVGTFSETITLDKKVTLRGAGRDRTFIDTTGDVTLTITAARAIVEEIGIYNHSGSAATVAPVKTGVNGVVIRNCYVSKYGANSTIAAGVWNSGAADLILENVTVVGEPTGTSSYGLYSDVNSGTNIIHGNIRGGTADIFGSDGGAAVYLFLPILYTPSYSWAGTVNGFFTDSNGGLHKIGSGGASQFVRQSILDGALSVSRIVSVDLPYTKHFLLMGA